jgi:GT2 family glycosyltransferase
MISGPKVSIIILNWNGLHDTLECLKSIYELNYSNFEVVVVDNGSIDNSAEIIKRCFAEAILIANEKNLGYATGNNIGIRYALNRGAQYVWLLNNDTVVEAQSLVRLIDTAKNDERMGLISPVIYHYDEPAKIQFCGCYADIDRLAFQNFCDLEPVVEKKFEKYLVLWGTALLIKRSVIEDIGYLKDNYFAYVEDYEYSIRAKKFGYNNTVRPDAKVYHKDSRSTGSRNSPLQVYLRARNTHFFWMDITKGFRKIKYFRHFLENSISYASALWNEQDFAAAEAHLNGSWAGILRIGGPNTGTFKLPPPIQRAILLHPFFWSNLLKGNLLEIARKLVKKSCKRPKNYNYR